MEPGDEIEFWSGDHGGCWKLGVMTELMRSSGRVQRYIRIKVGSKTFIVRKLDKCRLRQVKITA